MKNATLTFLIKRNDASEISQVLLAMKKRGFGANRWNGVGGKVHEGERIEEAAVREAKEEIEVDISIDNLKKVAKLYFFFPHEPDWDQVVHVYITEEWTGEPQETEEMKPMWYDASELPYDEMWSDDYIWVPYMLGDKVVRGTFTFDESDGLLDHSLEETDSL